MFGFYPEVDEDEPVASPWADVGLMTWLIRGSILGWIHQTLGGIT